MLLASVWWEIAIEFVAMYLLLLLRSALKSVSIDANSIDIDTFLWTPVIQRAKIVRYGQELVKELRGPGALLAGMD